MEQHVRIVGWMNIVFGILGIIAGMIAFFVMAGAGLASGDGGGAAVGLGIGSVIGAVAVIFSLPGLLGGVFLLRYRPWARILLIVLSCLNLINIPIGTLIGAYSLWVLFNDETRYLFERYRNY